MRSLLFPCHAASAKLILVPYVRSLTTLSRIRDGGPGFKDPIWISFSQDGPNIRLEPAPGQSFLTWTDESDSDADDNLGGQDSSDDEVSETATSDAEEVSKNQQVRKSRSVCPYMVKN